MTETTSAPRPRLDAAAVLQAAVPQVGDVVELHYGPNAGRRHTIAEILDTNGGAYCVRLADDDVRCGRWMSDLRAITAEARVIALTR